MYDKCMAGENRWFRENAKSEIDGENNVSEPYFEQSGR